MENIQSSHQNLQPNFWDKNRTFIKALIIGFLILIMLIPVSMVVNLVEEREQRQTEVVKEIGKKWASSQTINGPVMAIPYLTYTDSGKAPIKRILFLLPEKLNINGRLLPEVRHRSLYDVTLYRSDLELSGTFDPRTVDKVGIDAANILWGETRLMLGLDDVRGLEDDVHLQFGGEKTVLEAGLPENGVVKSGLSGKLPLDSVHATDFSLGIRLKGSDRLYFTPVGKTTEVALSSPWQNPAFDGQYLPTTPAQITDKGFTAKWKVLQVSRNYPQVWKDVASFDLPHSAFGVKLIQPTDNYAKTMRTVKYAILTIALTFAVFFLMETLQKHRIHPLQYILVGLALVIFYALLLSISEYIGFNLAYLIAMSATVLLISAYIKSIFHKATIALGFGVSLAALYTYIFILIQLQDYALLFGSIGLFLMLALLMYFSRKIDWYAVKTT